MKKAFTMVELIFVIVVLGILASVALPRLAANREDAEITKIKAQVASIRAGIQTKRNANLLQQSGSGTGGYPSSLDVDNNGLFGAVLNVAIPTGGNWTSKGSGSYEVKTSKGKTATFKYYATADKEGDTVKHKAGTFDCTPANSSDAKDLCNIINK